MGEPVVVPFPEGPLKESTITSGEPKKMLSFLFLILPVASAITVQTDLIGGRYKPSNERNAEVDAYYDLWGINATMLDQINEEDSHLEVWTLNQEGSGFSAYALVGEEAFGEQEWIWNAPSQRLSLSFSPMAASASLIGPNTIQIINLAGVDQITEIQTLKFTATGIEKTYVASKANKGTGKTVVLNSFDPRVDELGEPISAPLAFRHVPFSYPLVPLLMG